MLPIHFNDEFQIESSTWLFNIAAQFSNLIAKSLASNGDHPSDRQQQEQTQVSQADDHLPKILRRLGAGQ